MLPRVWHHSWLSCLLVAAALLICAPSSSAVSASGSVEVRRHRQLIRAVGAPSEASAASSPQSTCTPLKNHGTHSTVDVSIGTPGQVFSVVADTGSNSLIVPSCLCQKAGRCNAGDRCFQGTNKSSTFLIQTGGDGPPATRITFGSGTIDAVVATDIVKLGVIKVNMSNGILLMTDQALDITGSFEGILGLGLPRPEIGSEKNVQTSKGTDGSNKQGSMKSERMMRQRKGPGHPHHEPIVKVSNRSLVTDESVGSNLTAFMEDPKPRGIAEPVFGHDLDASETMDPAEPFADITRIMDAVMNRVLRGHDRKVVHSAASQAQASEHPSSSEGLGGKGVLDQAAIRRFSMCFNDAGSDGVLRLGNLDMPKPLGSVGRMHWSLGFHGISFGEGQGQNVSFMGGLCEKSSMKPGQTTPCGAIPDSGTTAIMAPQEHIDLLLDGVCDQWERCRKNYTALVTAASTASKVAMEEYGANPSLFQEASRDRKPKTGEKSKVLQFLLADCGNWLTPDKGLEELPPLKFHVSGADGAAQALELPGWAYVLEEKTSSSSFVNRSTVSSNGNAESAAEIGEGLESRVCAPAFSALDYYTEQNGPVWVLGTPFFYEYQVAYDLRAEPPAISFISTKDKPCGSCDAKSSALVTEALGEGPAEATEASKVSAAVGAAGVSQVAPARQEERARSRQPRRVHGPWRVPSLDTTLPL